MEDKTREEKIKQKCEEEFPEFVEVQSNIGVEELKRNLLKYALYREEIELSKKKDEKLKTAQDMARQLSMPYNDALKASKLKTAYIHILIQEKDSGQEKEG